MRGYPTPASTYPGTGSILVVNEASPAGPLNLTAEGTLDWCSLGSSTAAPRTLDRLNYRSKARARGLPLSDTFAWVAQGNWAVYTSAAAMQPTKTTTDSTGDNETAYASSMHISDGSGGFVNVGHGFRLRAMATTTSRVLRVYAGGYRGTVRCYARLSDDSAVEATSDNVFGDPATYRKWTIMYNAARDGQVLEVEVLMTARAGTANADVRFVAATLALV